jgi:hypothetical protein
LFEIGENIVVANVGHNGLLYSREATELVVRLVRRAAA